MRENPALASQLAAESGLIGNFRRKSRIWSIDAAYSVDKRPGRKSDPMTHDSAYDIVKRYHDAWTSGDVERAMDCVADDIICHAPGGDLEGKGVYREFLGAFAPSLIGIGDIAEFTAGDRVALFYYPQTATSSTTPAAELFTVREGRIAESVLIFDRLSYGPPQ